MFLKAEYVMSSSISLLKSRGEKKKVPLDRFYFEVLALIKVADRLSNITSRTV